MRRLYLLFEYLNIRPIICNLRIFPFGMIFSFFMVFCCTCIYAALPITHTLVSDGVKFQQSELDIRGRVVDADGTALASAIVTVTGAPHISTTVDLNGNFTLKIPASGSLRISRVGYIP